MSHPLNRLHKTFSRSVSRSVPILLSACCVCLPLSQAGCEGELDAADKQVRDHISQGQQKTETALSAAPAVPEGYKQAAAVPNASPAAKVDALMLLADAERDRAAALMIEADRLEGDLLRLIGAVNRQAVRIQSNNTLIAGLARLEPSKVTQAIEQQRAAAQGAKDPVWVPHETGAIQAMQGLEAQATKLQEQIGQLEGQAKDLVAQRAKLVADAEQLEKQSNEAQGQESAELFNQSVEARKQAADLSVQAEAVEAKLVPLRQDLERVQANQQAVAQAIEAFGGQLQTTQQGWKQVQEQIAALQQLNQRILNGGGAGEGAAPPAPAQPPAGAQPEADPAAGAGGASGRTVATSAPMAPSLTGKLRQIAELATQVDARRAEAESLIKEAMGHVDAAAAAAGSLVSQLRSRMGEAGPERPERKAWQQLSDLHAPSRFAVRRAALQIMLGDLYRSRSASLAARSNMQQVVTAAVQAAQLQVPQELGGQNLQAEAEAARAAAAAQYDEAEKGLEEVVQTAGSGDLAGDAAKAAHLLQLVRLYAEVQVNPELAKTWPGAAKTAAAAGEQVQLPPTALPSFVQDALELRPPPTPTPGTPPGATPPGATPPGATPPGATPPGATPPGATPPGTATPPGPTAGTDAPPDAAAVPAAAPTPAGQ